jgi:para-aminobenzoate synthetase / 4-amino-4-deoxychorismate lyase
MVGMQDPQLQRLLAVLSELEDVVFLDTSRPDAENCRSLLFLDRRERLCCRLGDDPQEYLQTLQQQLDRGHYLAGWVAYEFGALLEAGLAPRPAVDGDAGVVLADLGVYGRPREFDHHSGVTDFPLSADLPIAEEEYRIDRLRPNMNEEEFVAALEAVRRYIGAGDSYQVNYTMKLLFDFHGSPEALYRDLRRNQSVGYGAYLRRDGECILSFSPELFFRKSGKEITARPMKGTLVRGRYREEERERMRELHEDGKNRSENVMIVDLLRNDLSRLLHGHGQSRVYVQSLFDVEPYESLLQMTSTVKATADPRIMGNLKLTEIFRALFPCGSITGAPKIRTMEIINELEVGPRGVYTGAIGYFAPDGSAAFNVPIRTVRLQNGRGEMGVGAGITYDSEPHEEWRESLLKGRFLTHRQPQFHLFETLLWRQHGGYYLLDEHLERLSQAAEFFKFFCNIDMVVHRLAEVAASSGAACRRVRVRLEKDGRVAIDVGETVPPERLSLPLRPDEPRGGELPRVAFATERVETTSPWPFHKTSRRDLYNREYGRAKAEGHWDRLFCNERGEVTEGCISNIIIFREGQYLTPPVRCGLLPGVMRGKLLDAAAPPLGEAVLTEHEVRTAEAVYVCNSVRGVVRVTVL